MNHIVRLFCFLVTLFSYFLFIAIFFGGCYLLFDDNKKGFIIILGSLIIPFSMLLAVARFSIDEDNDLEYGKILPPTYEKIPNVDIQVDSLFQLK